MMRHLGEARAHSDTNVTVPHYLLTSTGIRDQGDD
jgi:hypothetical protein